MPRSFHNFCGAVATQIFEQAFQVLALNLNCRRRRELDRAAAAGIVGFDTEEVQIAQPQYAASRSNLGLRLKELSQR